MNSVAVLLFVSLFVCLGNATSSKKSTKTTKTTTTHKPTTTAPQGPVVNTSFGEVEGIAMKTADVFLGIPFATPPVGQLRFQPPKDPKPWNTTLIVKKFGDMCLQVEDFTTSMNLSMSENCLFLNVFTPKLGTDGLLPVMVFIHGGAYASGSASMYPVDGIVENLVSRGVVIVTTNYRLNVFGFFTTNTSSLPANLGLMDQIKALNWTQNEIRNFGGDPKNVTVFGESAGAGSVSLLTYSPKAKGLFHKAIMQSGSAYGPWSLDGINGVFQNSSRDLAISSGCLTESDWNSAHFNALPHCLRNMSAETLLNMSTNATRWMPLVDGEGGVLPDWPQNLAKYRDPKMPVILGTNHDEEAFPYIFDLLHGKINETVFSNKTFEKRLRYVASDRQFGKYAPKVRDIIRFLYLESKPPIAAKDYVGWFKTIVQMTSGYGKFAPTSKEAQTLTKYNNTNVYLYTFDYVSDGFPWPKGFKATFHAMDLFFLFKTMWQHDVPIQWNFTKNDKGISEQFGQLWTEFAKTGKPTKSWTPLSANKTHGVAYSINVTSAMIPEYETLASHLWNDLIPEIFNGHEGPTEAPPNGDKYGKAYFFATWLLLAAVVISVVIILIMIMKHHRENTPYESFN